ncbi:MAG: hypothetical protein NVSMB5_11760 [Candidatus Velthaea sp.]
MLEVRFRRDSRQRLSSVLAAGHADAAVHGEDIVCAAASAILQAAELGLAAYAKLDTAAVTRAQGEMTFRIAESARDRDDVKAIIGTAELAIERLAWQFPVHVRFVREAEPQR